MKYILILIVTSISVNLLAQDADTYDYQSPDLMMKPAPTKAFTSWLAENNEKLGKKAPYSTEKSTRVTLVFTVDAEGNLLQPQIWRGIGQGYDEYALKLIKANPHKWKAGSTEEGPVATLVYFQLDYMKNKNSIRNRANQRID